MRIIAGSLGGRIFDSPGGHRTHPMSDRVRGALFNALGDIEGLTVLDAFAGSGALSFEAVSRGAGSVIAVESDKAAQNTIADNIKTLGVQLHVQLIRASVGAWLRTTPEANFDIVLCDPPYDDLQPKLLTRLAARTRIGGLVVLSWPGKQTAPSFEGFNVATQHNYGDAQLVFYRRIS